MNGLLFDSMLWISERELIIKLHFKGKSQREITDLIGCAQSAVSRWIKRYGAAAGLEKNL